MGSITHNKKFAHFKYFHSFVEQFKQRGIMATALKLKTPETIDELVEGLKVLTESNVEPNEIVDYMGTYKNTDWTQYAVWDPYRYTRNLVGENDQFNLILLCWSEGNASLHFYWPPIKDCLV